MGNGLLAWWHRRTASSGMAGAALCAVPVAVSVLIGFGASLSGVAGGLATLTRGPDATSATPASAKTDPTDPKESNRALSALTSKTGSSVGSDSGLGSTTGADPGLHRHGRRDRRLWWLRWPRWKWVGVFDDQRARQLRRLKWRFLRRRLVGVFANPCPQRHPARDGWGQQHRQQHPRRRQQHGQQHPRRRQQHRQQHPRRRQQHRQQHPRRRQPHGQRSPRSIDRPSKRCFSSTAACRGSVGPS